MSIKAVLTDIEGTTSSLSFVKDVLFPYAEKKLPDYVRLHKDDAKVAALLKEAGSEAGTEDTEEIIQAMLSWIREDRKVTPLKSLQGLIWESGYKNGDFTGHIYQDALEALWKWKAEGISLYVYSSGSVYAQKLLFGHTAYGSLTDLFSGYFDTKIGQKKETDSYRKICDEIGLEAGEIMFLSDIAEELDAAKEAGMKTCQLIREGQPESGHPHACDFSKISLD